MKKKRLVLCVISIVVLALVLVVRVLYSSFNSTRLTRQLDLGQKYLNELHYEQAVSAFKEALSIDKDNKDARELLVTAYIGWADKLESEGNTERAIEVLNEGFQFLGDQRLQEKLDVLSASMNESLKEKARYDTLDHCIALCDAGDYYGATAYALERYIYFTESLEGSNGSFIYGEGEKKLGIYEVSDVIGLDFAVYYGNYDNEMRQGTGVWFNPGGAKYYIGTWDHDMPEGAFQYNIMSMINESNQKFEVYEGNVSNGLWDGLVTSTDTNIPDLICKTFFENGRVITQYVYGDPFLLTAYDMNGELSYAAIPAEDASELLSNTYGIVGFGKEHFGGY